MRREEADSCLKKTNDVESFGTQTWDLNFECNDFELEHSVFNACEIMGNSIFGKSYFYLLCNIENRNLKIEPSHMSLDFKIWIPKATGPL